MTHIAMEPAVATGIAPQTVDVDVPQAQALATEAVALVRHWLTEASKVPVDASAEQLAGVLKDPNGLDFTVGFVDGVVRPEDLNVAARNLAALAPKVPAFLPWYMRRAVQLGGTMAPVLPQVVIPVARKVLREMVGHLIVDATEAKLGPAIAKIRKDGIKLNVNLLGEAVLGEHEASRRLEGTHTLLARPDVDYVSIKVSSTVAPHSAWAFDEAVEHVVEKLTPLFQRAASFAAGGNKAKFINLDMEEYKDLDMTIAVFTRILDKPEFKDLEAGIVLQAYLPDALSAMIRLQDWAAERRADGGAAIKVRVVKGANLPMEQVESSLHDWPLATWGSKQDSDTSYKSVINYSLHPGADQEHPDRCGRPQPVRHRLRLAPGQAARHRGYRTAEHRVRNAAGNGPGPGRSRQEGRRLAAALHPGGASGRVRRRHRLPDPPPRRGREPGQLHVRSLRAERKRGVVRAREAALPRLARGAGQHGSAGQPAAEPQPAAGPDGQRQLRKYSRHRPVPARQTVAGAAPSWTASPRPRSATPPWQQHPSATRPPSTP
jgi:proline dehydrogenase